jgi:hypothetical protein
LRIGWIVSSTDRIQELSGALERETIAIGGIAQRQAAWLLEAGNEALVRTVVEGRTLVQGMLGLISGAAWSAPAGGTQAFVRLPVQDVEAFCDYVLVHFGLALASASNYEGVDGPFVRVALGYPAPVLERAILLLAEGLARYRAEVECSHSQSTVDFETATVEEVTLDRKAEPLENLARLAEAPNGNALHPSFEDGGLHGRQNWRAHETGRDGDRTNSVSGELAGPDDGLGHGSRLGGGIARLPGVARARDGGDIDDDAGANLGVNHVSHDFTGEKEGTGEIDVHHGLPLGEGQLEAEAALLRSFDEETVAIDSRVAHESVQISQVPCGALDSRHDISLIGHIDDIGFGETTCASRVVDQAVETIAIDVKGSDPRTSPRERKTELTADSAGGARYDDSHLLQFHGRTFAREGADCKCDERSDSDFDGRADETRSATGSPIDRYKQGNQSR